MKFAVLFFIIQLLAMVDLFWSLAHTADLPKPQVFGAPKTFAPKSFGAPGFGLPPGLGAPPAFVDPNANAPGGYLPILDKLQRAIGELTFMYDSLVRDNKREEAAMLREQLVSMLNPLYGLQFNNAIPPKPSQSSDHFVPPSPMGFPGAMPGLERGPDVNDFRSPNNVPDFPPGMPDHLKKRILDSAKARMDGKYPGDMSATAFRDMRKVPATAGLDPSKFTPPMNLRDPRSRISSSFSAVGTPPSSVSSFSANTKSASADPARKTRVDKFTQFLRERVDDMLKRVEVSKNADSSARVDVAQLKLDIEKYYLAEVDLINFMEDDASELLKMSQQNQAGRAGPLDASTLKHDAGSSDQFAASRQSLMEPGAFQGRGSPMNMIMNNGVMDKRDKVKIMRDDVMARIERLESKSR